MIKRFVLLSVLVCITICGCGSGEDPKSESFGELSTENSVVTDTESNYVEEYVVEVTESQTVKVY